MSNKFSGIWVIGILGASLHSGCRPAASVDAAAWSKPEVVSMSRDSLSASFSLYRWNGSLMALAANAGECAAHFLSEDGTAWKKVPLVDVGCFPVDCDPMHNVLAITRGRLQSDRVEVGFVIGSLNSEGSLRTKTNGPLVFTKQDLFGTTSKSLVLSRGDRLGTLLFAGGSVDGDSIFVPYCIQATAMVGNTIVSRDGRSSDGIFYSLDAGQTWHAEHVSDLYSVLPSICRTTQHYYYFAAKILEDELWCSRKVADGGLWSPPVAVVSTFPSTKAVFNYQAVADSDTVHLCWLDRRHEKKRLNLVYPNRENYEVVYCNRGDSDRFWNKDVILSRGIVYSYSPSLSVEGHRVVVAWAGVESGEDGRNEYDPSDIYYATSKDGGKTWSKPLQVTDGFKACLTAGRPQVALHNGVIHLFYIQGKLNFKKEGGGMVKLNQPPWPIYYQQRPFPN